VLHGVLTNGHVRSEDKEIDHLTSVFHALNAAGTTTTAHVLSVISFHLLHNRMILKRLQKELREVMPEEDSTPNWGQLEKIPYFVSFFRH
jgi:cytochrome P450